MTFHVDAEEGLEGVAFGDDVLFREVRAEFFYEFG